MRGPACRRPRALVAAEIALAENDGARAIQELDQIAVPTAAEQAQNSVDPRPQRLSHRAPDRRHSRPGGARALSHGPRQLACESRRVVQQDPRRRRTRSIVEAAAEAATPSSSDGWNWGRWPSDSSAIPSAPRRPSPTGGACIRSIRRMRACCQTASNQIAAATEFPDQIALLLPLSGRSEGVGVAVRDGFIAAYLEQDPATRPRLKIYDVAAESVASAYTRLPCPRAQASWLVRSPRKTWLRWCP